MILKKIVKYRTPTLLLVFLQYLLFSGTTLFAADFRVDSYQIENNNGHFKLQWEAAAGSAVEVQKSDSQDFRNAILLYTGIDRASFISGLENGSHYFRVREKGSQWSPTLTINVKHQSLKLAFTLFTLGAIVFLLTVFVVIKGMRQVRD